jgi:hypothetical protein
MNTIEEKPQSLLAHALRHGAIMGAISIALTVIIYMVSIPFMGTLKFVLLMFAIFISYVIYAGIDYRKTVGGFLAYGKAYLHGLVVLASAGFIGTLFGLVLYNVIDTELADKLTETILSNTEETMRGFNTPEENIEKQLDDMRESLPKQFSTLGQIKSFFTGMIWNAVLVALTSFIVRKSEPVEA